VKELTMFTRCIVLVATTACTAALEPTEITPDAAPEPPAVCAPARTYPGFGGPLEVGRSELTAGTDRLRLKPYEALASEYRRVLGLATFSTARYASTIGQAPARWYLEPAASASSLQGTFMLAFDACLLHTETPAAFGTHPKPDTAAALCRDLARAAWDRDATDAQVVACRDFIVSHTPIGDTARRRWAYGCAAVLNAPGFLAY
jgi:hypothetical protein